MVVPCNRSRGLEYGVDVHWGSMNGRRSERSDSKAALYVHMVMLIVALVFLNLNLRMVNFFCYKLLSLLLNS